MDEEVLAAWRRREEVEITGESRLVFGVPLLVGVLVAAAALAISHSWLSAIIFGGCALELAEWRSKGWLVRREAGRRAAAWDAFGPGASHR